MNLPSRSTLLGLTLVTALSACGGTPGDTGGTADTQPSRTTERSSSTSDELPMAVVKPGTSLAWSRSAPVTYEQRGLDTVARGQLTLAPDGPPTRVPVSQLPSPVGDGAAESAYTFRMRVTNEGSAPVSVAELSLTAEDSRDRQLSSATTAEGPCAAAAPPARSLAPGAAFVSCHYFYSDDPFAPTTVTFHDDARYANEGVTWE